MEQIAGSPKLATLLYVELGWVLFVLLLRAWRFSKCAHWGRRLWVDVWTSAVFWVAALVVLPWIVLGMPYYQVVNGAVMAVMGSIEH